MSELKPCPFCGDGVEMVNTKTYPNGERSPAYIKCKTCNYHIADYEDEILIHQWNTRPIEDELRAELARRDAVIEQLIFDHKIAVAERERLTAELVEKGEYENKLVNPVESMLEEIEKLQSIIDDYREGIAKTLEERCPSDERHCGCVPILRQEIDRLKNEKDNRGWWES